MKSYNRVNLDLNFKRIELEFLFHYNLLICFRNLQYRFARSIKKEFSITETITLSTCSSLATIGIGHSLGLFIIAPVSLYFAT